MTDNTTRIANIAICQMKISPDKHINLQKAELMIRKAYRDNRSDIVVLPEMFNCPYFRKFFQVRLAECFPELQKN